MTNFEAFPVLTDAEASRNERGGRTWRLTRNARLPDDFNIERDVVEADGWAVYAPEEMSMATAQPCTRCGAPIARPPEARDGDPVPELCQRCAYPLLALAEEVLAKDKEATSAPWQRYRRTAAHPRGHGWNAIDGKDGNPVESEADAAFIVTARNAAPRLAAFVRDALAVLEASRREHDRGCIVWYGRRSEFGGPERKCTCGCDEHNARINALLDRYRETTL